MAARKIRGEVRHRKVTVFARPPELNVILEDQQAGRGPDRVRSQSHPPAGSQRYAGDIPKLNGASEPQTCLNPSVPDSFRSQDLSAEGYNRRPMRLQKVSAKSEQATNTADGHSETLLGGNGELWDSEDFFPSWSRKPSMPQQNDALVRVKQCASKLNLPTRRPSYLKWRQEHFGPGDTPLVPSVGHNGEANSNAGHEDATWSPERRQKVDAMLAAIKKDLQALREEDQTLARRLMTLRRSIHDVKMSRYYAANRDLLEEAMFNEERDELDELCDLPPRLFSPALKQYGLTRMNVQTRRFSVF